MLPDYVAGTHEKRDLQNTSDWDNKYVKAYWNVTGFLSVYAKYYTG